MTNGKPGLLVGGTPYEKELREIVETLCHIYSKYDERFEIKIEKKEATKMDKKLVKIFEKSEDSYLVYKWFFEKGKLQEYVEELLLLKYKDNFIEKARELEKEEKEAK